MDKYDYKPYVGRHTTDPVTGMIQVTTELSIGHVDLTDILPTPDFRVFKREDLQHYDVGTKWHSVKTRVTFGFKEHVEELLALK